MDVLEKSEFFDDDANFIHGVVVYRIDSGQVFRGVCSARVFGANDVRLEELRDVEDIPLTIYPDYDPSVFGMKSSRRDENYFVKRPSLIYYQRSEKDDTSTLMVNEASVYQALVKSPHKNLATYVGCEVVDGKVTGLHLQKYPKSLSDRLRDEKELKVPNVLADLRSAVDHLHNLGFCHNDINSSNIMFDKNDRVVLIDFDSCAVEGAKLIKGGTPGWADGFLETSSRQNDIEALEKVAQYMQRS